MQEKFDVEFTFIGGEKYTFTDYQSGSYVHVVNEIKDSENGWFGAAGEVVNLANVDIGEFDYAKQKSPGYKIVTIL